jgi:hypothetical protein
MTDESEKVLKAIATIDLPPSVALFMQRYGARATATIKAYVDPCSTIDEKLGALSCLAQVLLAYGDTLSAIQLSKVKGAKN